MGLSQRTVFRGWFYSTVGSKDQTQVVKIACTGFYKQDDPTGPESSLVTHRPLTGTQDSNYRNTGTVVS